MKALHATTRTNGQTVLDDEAIQQLVEHLRGDLLYAGHDGYEEARRVWNGLMDKRPCLIARCRGTADVNFAGFGEESDALAQAAYGPGYERLRQVKATHDPENRFCVNQNIAPAENGRAPT